MLRADMLVVKDRKLISQISSDLIAAIQKLLPARELRTSLDIPDHIRAHIIMIMDELYRLKKKELTYFSNHEKGRRNSILVQLIALRDDEIFKHILKFAFSINFDLKLDIYYGYTAFEFALLSNNTGLISSIMSHPSFNHENIETYIKFALEHHCSLLIIKTLNANTLSHLAISSDEMIARYPRILKLFLDNPEDDAKEFIATIKNPTHPQKYQYANHNPISFFTAANEKNVLNRELFNTQTTPLALAIEYNRLDVIKHLMNAGSEINIHIASSKQTLNINEVEYSSYLDYALNVQADNPNMISYLLRCMTLTTTEVLLVLEHAQWKLLIPRRSSSLNYFFNEIFCSFINPKNDPTAYLVETVLERILYIANIHNINLSNMFFNIIIDKIKKHTLVKISLITNLVAILLRCGYLNIHDAEVKTRSAVPTIFSDQRHDVAELFRKLHSQIKLFKEVN